MIKNFLTVALRNFLREKLYSWINVLGLASGLGCALFIYLWVKDEVSKDKFHHDNEKIFHVVTNMEVNDRELITWTITPGLLADDIRENIPEVEYAARTMDTGEQLFQYEEKNFMEHGYYADPTFFSIFSFPVVKGKPNNNASDISSISISEKLARKLFGDEDPIGKAVKVNKETDYIVTAVFKDITAASSLQFDYILPFEVFRKRRGDGFNWGNYDHPLYLKLRDRGQASAVIQKINERATERKADSGNVSFYLQPFSEFYLYSLYENGIPIDGRIKYVKVFTAVAVFILLIACINFMNMATARAANRSKEVGIRKVVGAQRKSIIFQFMAESILVTFISMLLAVAAVALLLPMFNLLVGKQIVLDFSNGSFLLTLTGIVLVTGMFAGSYPAFFLSSYQPTQVLKGTLSATFSGASLRRILVVFQFSLTVILIASSLVVYNQIEYIRNKNLGYDRQSVLSFSTTATLREAFEGFRNEAIQVPGVVHITRANENLVQIANQNSSVTWPGKPENSQQFFRTVVVDYGYLETMGLKIEEGRFFSEDRYDTASYILTRKAVEVMGLKEPVGTQINQWGRPGTVVGVVNDFHGRSLHEAVDPVVFMLKPEWTRNVFVRFEGNKTADVIASLERVYKKYNPDYPFTYTFLDDEFEKLYNNEKVTRALALGFTFMAIVISGLSLLGLASYNAEKKKKEIGIRKTLGASVGSIVNMMSQEFLRLSVLSALIGCPAAYFMMEKFLSGYAYHTELGWDIFIITAITVCIFSLLTVIFQVLKAAVANPVDALRSE